MPENCISIPLGLEEFAVFEVTQLAEEMLVKVEKSSNPKDRCASINYRVTNGYTEGINNKPKLDKGVA